MNQQPQLNNHSQQNPCHICGSQEFVWGRTIGGTNDWVYFRTKGGWWGEGEKLHARKCIQCQNVQLFADVEY